MTLSSRAYVAFVLCTVALTGVTAAPVFTCGNTVADFGTVKEADAVTRTFTVTNTGDEPLVIRKIRNTCGACMTTQAEPMEIPPGEQGTITATVKLNGLNGPVRKFFYVETNVPEKPPVRFTMEGVVHAGYSLKPTGFFFIKDLEDDDRREDSQRKWEFHLTLPETGEFRITEIEGPHGFDIEVETTGRLAEHIISVSPRTDPVPPGLARGSVRISTDSDTSSSIEIPFFAEIDSSVSLLPPRLFLPTAEEGEFLATAPLLQRVVRAVDRSGRGVAIKEAKSSAQELCLEQHGSVLVVQLSRPVPPGTHGEIIVTAGDEPSRAVLLPFTVVSTFRNEQSLSPSKNDGSGRPSPSPKEAVSVSVDEALSVVAEVFHDWKEEDWRKADVPSISAVADWALRSAHIRCDSSALAGEDSGLRLLRREYSYQKVNVLVKTDGEFAERCKRAADLLKDRTAPLNVRKNQPPVNGNDDD